MSDHLIRHIRTYLDTHTDDTAAAIEQRAKVPPATIANIFRGSRPKPERLAQILTTVDATTAAEWLRAYLLDAVPEQRLADVEIIVRTASALQEAPRLYAGQKPDRLTLALDHLRQLATRNDDVAQWLIDTAALFGSVELAMPSREGMVPISLEGLSDEDRELITSMLAQEGERGESAAVERTVYPRPKRPRKATS